MTPVTVHVTLMTFGVTCETNDILRPHMTSMLFGITSHQRHFRARKVSVHPKQLKSSISIIFKGWRLQSNNGLLEQ